MASKMLDEVLAAEKAGNDAFAKACADAQLAIESAQAKAQGIIADKKREALANADSAIAQARAKALADEQQAVAAARREADSIVSSAKQKSDAAVAALKAAII